MRGTEGTVQVRRIYGQKRICGVRLTREACAQPEAASGGVYVTDSCMACMYALEIWRLIEYVRGVYVRDFGTDSRVSCLARQRRGNQAVKI
jgi:hypothetical protein